MESRLTPYEPSPLIACNSALVFAPHPDDEVLGCGGLLAAYQAAGVPVQAVLVTSGDYGEHGKAGSAVREQETLAATALLGVHAVEFWREKDRHVHCDARTIAKAREAIVNSEADLILTPSIHEIHPDHRATAWLVIEACRALVLEGRDLRVAMFEIGAPLARVDVLVDITAHEQRKREAVKLYHSQLDISPFDDFIFALNRFRTYTMPAHVAYAEAYSLLTPEQLREPWQLSESELMRQERLQLTDIPMPAAYRPAPTDSLWQALLKPFRGQNH
ncbi:MAG: PIG-L deacetylase family protein [Gammaproteobacteria bacterium]